LQRVSGWLAEASLRLGRGVECLHATSDGVSRAPESAGDAPRLLIAVTQRWVDAATQLATVSNRLDETFSGLVGYVKGGAPLDLEEIFKKDRPAPKLVVIRRPSAHHLSIESNRIFCIHVRRQRSARLTVAEAPRRIFRGRAPPLLSTCSL
jgi:hypothetical protein